MQLPEIKQLDIATPIATYYATKRQNELDSLNKENIRADNEVNRMKLDEYKSGAEQRRKDAEMDRVIKAVSLDKEFVAFGEKLMLGLDPEDPDFQKKGIEAAVELAKYANSRGMPPEYAAGLAERAVKMYSPEALKQAQIKAGLREKPKQEVVNGQLVTIEDGKATAQKIAGLEKKTDADTPLGKLIAAHDELPDGHPNKAIYAQAIAKETAPTKGQSFRVLPDGTVEVVQGGDDLGLTKPTMNKIQEKQLNATEALGRLAAIKESYNSTAKNYLTAEGKARMAKADLMLKAGRELSTDDKKYVEDATQFYSRSLENLNKTLNELSGAAVTQQEFDRISQTMPNPGKKGITNILSGDNKVEFESKLNDTIKMQRLALARLSFVEKNGFSISKTKDGKITGFKDGVGKNIGLDDMPKIMAKRAGEVAAEIEAANPGITRTEIAPQVKAALAKEFGLAVQ